MTDLTEDDPTNDESRSSRHTRRGLFTAIGAAAVGGAAGWAVRGASGSEGSAASTIASPAPTESSGDFPGVTFPAVPQRYIHVTVASFPGITPQQVLERARALPALSQTADAGEVTVTIGFAPRLAAELWPDRAVLAADLPPFTNDTDNMRADGDIAIQVCAETATGTHDAAQQILAGLKGAEIAWERDGYRDAPTPEGTSRTNTGFIDGIANPRSSEGWDKGVFTEFGDTYAVFRRMLISADFLRKSVTDQERAIGRKRDTGAPLSGGSTMDRIDLQAKSPDGRALIPQAAHARRSQPTAFGRPLMLRRSYSFDAVDGAGLLFVAFLNDAQTFVVTQRRLDEQDALIRHTVTDASGVFFVPRDLV